jgi:uncharacterized repeat protein (TIGR03843 family)
MFGSNSTFLVTVEYKDLEFPAVYKPSRGEQPLWDFPASSLASREVAAYLVSEAMGLNFVPCTVLRHDPALYGPGSLQQYIDYDPDYHYFNFSEEDKRRLPAVVLFDLLVNNADRKGSHVLIEKGTGKLWAIDHGLCFHEDDKLRTVLWDFAGRAIPQNLLRCLAAVPGLLEMGGELRLALWPLLNPREIMALSARAQKLLAAKIFPSIPMDRRAYPYPPL